MSRRASAKYWYAMSRSMGHTRYYSLRLAGFAWITRLEQVTFSDPDQVANGLLHVDAEYIESQRDVSLMQ